MPAARRTPIIIPADEDRVISRREAALRLDVSVRTVQAESCPAFLSHSWVRSRWLW
jgi:hypothetical protein